MQKFSKLNVIKVGMVACLLVFFIASTCVVEGSSDEKAEQEFMEIQRVLDKCEIGFLDGIRRYRKIIKKYPESEMSARAFYATGDLFEKLGEVEKASIAYMSVIESYPDSECFSPAVRDLYRIGCYLFNFKKERLFKNTYGQARKIFVKILEVADSIEYAAEIQYKVGYCSLELGEYEEAASEFQKVVESYPEEPWLEKAEYRLGISFFKQSLPAQRDQTMTDKAIIQFNRFLGKYPESQFVEDAKEKLSILRERKAEKLYSLCLFYLKQKEKKAFSFYCQELVRRFPDTEWAELARELPEI
jgi:outer membrane protein assembly factor BamD